MKAIVNGTFLMDGVEISRGALMFDQTIAGHVPVKDIPAGCEIIDAHGAYVSPGLIDLHIHGYHGEDASDGSPEGLKVIAKGLLENGVTAFLPTTMTVSWEEIEAAFDVIRVLRGESQEPGFDGAQILGAHAEGPFINPRRKGAQAEESILPPDAGRILKHKDIVSILTMAPEMPGGLEMISQVTSQSDIVVSIGHTEADFELANKAIDAGANHITHLFNAMTGLNHRKPGVVGAALSRGVVTELIADTFHVHAGLFGLLQSIKQDKLVLVTDCTRAGGLRDGEYTLGGQPIFVKGIECRLADGTIAGSVLKLNHAVRNLRDKAGLTTAQAVAHASQYPAGVIGMGETKGSLRAGMDADIVLFDEQLNTKAAYIRGIKKYERE